MMNKDSNDLFFEKNLAFKSINNFTNFKIPRTQKKPSWLKLTYGIYTDQRWEKLLKILRWINIKMMTGLIFFFFYVKLASSNDKKYSARYCVKH